MDAGVEALKDWVGFAGVIGEDEVEVVDSAHSRRDFVGRQPGRALPLADVDAKAGMGRRGQQRWSDKRQWVALHVARLEDELSQRRAAIPIMDAKPSRFGLTGA